MAKTASRRPAPVLQGLVLLSIEGIAAKLACGRSKAWEVVRASGFPLAVREVLNTRGRPSSDPRWLEAEVDEWLLERIAGERGVA